MTLSAQPLVVSPDRSLLQIAQRCLEELGHAPLIAQSVLRARRLLARGRIDLLCLDSLVPPDEAERCWSFTRAACDGGGPPLLYFAPASARLLSSTLPSFYHRERDAVVAKPIDREEFARAVARLLAARPRRDELLSRVGSIALDGGRHELLFATGGALRLTPTEFKLLRCLMGRAGEFFSANELLEQVWGYPAGTGGPEIVRAHVSNLRRKLREAGEDPQLVRTLPYRGYGFAAASQGS